MNVPLIELRNISQRFRVRAGPMGETRHVTAVDGVSLTLTEGQVLGVVGESGCGKSTLARIILGLQEPTAGEEVIGGQRLVDIDRRARARLIQPVFQDPYSSLNPRRRVRDIVALPLAAQETIAAEEMRARVDDMLVRVGLDPAQGERWPAELSGGQRQRVAIARALVLRPRIVVCDEPTSALDVSVQAQILNLLAALREEFGLTYLFISHNLAVVQHVADDVAVMYLGRIVERDETDRLFREPRHPYTRALLASVLTPEPGLGLPETGLNDIMPDAAAIPSGCRFHPRCPVALERCAADAPVPVGDGRGEVECHLFPAP